MKVLRLCLLAGLLTALALFLGSTLPRVQFQRGADEGVYLTYAARVAKGGLAGLRGLFPLYAAHDKIAQYGGPPPYRLTVTLLDALAVRLGGVYCTSLAVVSLWAFLALLAVTFWGVKELWGERTAWWTVLLLSTAPLHLAMARRALSDTLNSLTLAAGLLLLCVGVWGPTKRVARAVWWVIPAAFVTAFLVKENGLLLVPISLGLLGWQAVREGRRPAFWRIAAVSWIPLSLAFAAVLFAAGGFKPLWEAARFLVGGGGNLYGQRLQNGPWYRTLVDLMLLSPWPVLLYLVGLGVFSTDKKPDEKFWFWALMPVAQILLVVLPPCRINVRFLILSEMAMRLCSVLLLQRLLGDRPGNLRSALLMGAAVLAWICTDLKTFHQLFVAGGIYDPVSVSLLASRGFLPPP